MISRLKPDEFQLLTSRNSYGLHISTRIIEQLNEESYFCTGKNLI